jgi:hypothetical protein
MLLKLTRIFLATKTSAFAKATADRLRHEEKLDADFAGCAGGFSQIP